MIMRSFLHTLIDALFPPSPNALFVRSTTPETLLAQYAPRSIGGITALTEYRTPLMRALIHEAKFHMNERAITLLGTLLAHHLTTIGATHAHIIPIPLARKRLRERGYNQVARIVALAQALVPAPLPNTTLLTKIHETAPQTTLTRSERLSNLAGAFAVGTHALSLDTPLIICDDITTTGSTLEEAGRALRTAGFTHITLLALAH